MQRKLHGFLVLPPKGSGSGLASTTCTVQMVYTEVVGAGAAEAT